MTAVIEVESLHKSYRHRRGGRVRALDGLDLSVRAGGVFGFLGPNGSGKTTTIRCLLGLARPGAGHCRVLGAESPRELPDVVARVGSLVESPGLNPGVSGRRTLTVLATAAGLGHGAVDRTLARVGLAERGDDLVGGYSLGMRQRLGIGIALLKDPELLVLDEPVNGLDPAGIREVRDLIRTLGAEGRTVFLSSHLMGEMAKTADHLVVIGKGRIIADASVESLLAQHAAHDVLVRAEQQPAFTAQLVAHGGAVRPAEDGAVAVLGLESRAIGAIAAASGITLIELTPRHASLEDAFLELTHESTDYQSAALAAHTSGA